MNEQQFQELLERYRLGECNEEEKILLESWYIDHAAWGQSVDFPTERQEKASWQNVLERSGLARRRQVIRIRYWSAAAAVLLLVGVGGSYYFSRPAPGPATPLIVKADVRPGSEKAILTLADGKTISLTDVPNGQLAIQGQVTINKTGDGQIEYQGTGQEAVLSMNNVATPRGGQYHLVLADGSKVWLNAASSIQYPVAFSGKERRVVVTGEAYFEVAPDKSKPFRVEAGDQTIDVLGTSFNVNVYADEPVHKTTLLSGSVKVANRQQQLVLTPGEQARSSDQKALTRSDKVDLEDVMDWKKGDFVFNNEDLSSIMRKIARWYDVDISYQGSPGPLHFDGIVSRTKNISSVLQIMEATGKIHFQIEKRRLMVIANP